MTAERFPGGGECGALVREFDWAKTDLGAPESWPKALVAMVRLVLNAAAPLMLWWGPDLVQFHNDHMRANIGTRFKTAFGRPAREVWAAAWPVVGETLERVYAKGESAFLENVNFPLLDGGVDNRFWAYAYSPAFDDDGKVAGVCIMCRETTQQVHALAASKRSEAELHEIFLQAPLPIAVLTGPNHHYALANPAYEAMVGRKTRGKDVLGAFTEAEVGYFVPLLDKVFQTGEHVDIHEAPLHLVGEDGTRIERFIDATYQPYRASDDSILGVLAFHNDVTAAVRARKDLESSARARDEFLAMLGHELRNPLAPISTATTLMKMRGDHNPKEREIIDRQVAHLSRLVDDLLDVSRVARGRIELQERPLAIGNMIRHAIEMVSPLLEQRAHHLTVSVAPEPLFVLGDETRLAQIFSNILSNAAKYTDRGGFIDVSATRRANEVIVAISDSGPGVSEELLPRIFELFVQGEQPLDRKLGGLGLGLALVKNLVSLHRGSVAAQNRADGGLLVTVTLPLVEDGAAPAAEMVRSAPSKIPPSRRAQRILVVDDNQDAALLLATFLQNLGHDVVVAHDGGTALKSLVDFAAELALLDIGLPEMDGYELARRIRAEFPKVRRLVAVTGYGQPRDREATKAAGFDLHLTKPLDLGALAKVIEGD